MSATEVDVIDRRRYQRILWFFARVVGHLIWWDLLLGRVLKGRVRRTRPERFRKLARRFRELAVNLGGVMIKLGQFLSARVDVLPPEVTEELAGLQDEVPPVPPADIERVLAEEWGDPLAHLAYFDPQPLAAASLGQAHRGWLRPENGHSDERVAQSESVSQGERGPQVVVKVQRPGIEDIVRTDLAALRVVARWTMRYPPIRRRANVPALMEEFSATLWEELDYYSEADNAVRFGQMFARRPEIRIPAVYREHCTGRILVLEDVGGIKITDMAALEQAGIDLGQVASRLMDAYFHQIFDIGFFHADPHPGNLFIRPLDEELGGDVTDDTALSANGDGASAAQRFELSFVDFGMVGHVEELMSENLRDLLVSVTQRDAWGLTQAYNELGFFLPGSDLERIAEAQERLLNQLWGRNLLELSQPDPQEIQELSREFRDLLFEFPFQVPQDFIYLGRTLGMLSGLATLLDPTINPWHLVEQYGQKIIRSREARQLGMELLREWVQAFVSLPTKLDRVLAAAESGRLRLATTPDRALDRRLERLEKKIGRTSWSVLIAAVLLSGTLLYLDGAVTLGWFAWVFAGLLLIVSWLRT